MYTCLKRGQLTRFSLVNFPLADSHHKTVAVEAFVCHKYFSQSIIDMLSLLRTVLSMILRIPNIGLAYQCKHLAGREGASNLILEFHYFQLFTYSHRAGKQG